jgi:predicted amidohydrolase YtcJ
MSIRAPFLLLGLIAAGSAYAAPTLLVDARIHTLDPAAPHAEAMAWDEDGRLLALGTKAELRERFRGAREVSLGGQTVIPGLIDAHGHLMNLGHALLRANLMGASSKAEIVERLRQHARDLPPGAWLLGRGWDQTLWPEAEFPTAADLDAHFPDRPVWLERVDGHAGWGNSLALAASTRDLSGDWQPEGGRILRDDQGQATGVFIDSAEQFIVEAIPAPSDEVDALALERALAESARFGLTGVHDAGVSLKQLALYRRFADSGRLPLRIHAMANGDAEALDALCAMGHYRHPSGRLQMRSVKLYIDGALGSRGAALLEDYSDEPGNRGLLFAEPPAFEKILAKAHACGVQVAAHAIGDRGNRVVLDGMQRVLGEARGDDHRWRIEHAQVVALGDISRFAQLGGHRLDAAHPCDQRHALGAGASGRGSPGRRLCLAADEGSGRPACTGLGFPGRSGRPRAWPACRGDPPGRARLAGRRLDRFAEVGPDGGAARLHPGCRACRLRRKRSGQPGGWQARRLRRAFTSS